MLILYAFKKPKYFTIKHTTKEGNCLIKLYKNFKEITTVQEYQKQNIFQLNSETTGQSSCQKYLPSFIN